MTLNQKNQERIKAESSTSRLFGDDHRKWGQWKEKSKRLMQVQQIEKEKLLFIWNCIQNANATETFRLARQELFSRHEKFPIL